MVPQLTLKQAEQLLSRLSDLGLEKEVEKARDALADATRNAKALYVLFGFWDMGSVQEVERRRFYLSSMYCHEPEATVQDVPRTLH